MNKGMIVPLESYRLVEYVVPIPCYICETENGRDSESKRLGAKRADGQFVLAGNILVRQRVTHIHPGDNVGRGKDDTLFAKIDGLVRFHHLGKFRKQVSVLPVEE